MKRILIFLLAVVFAVSSTVPAMALDLTIDGPLQVAQAQPQGVLGIATNKELKAALANERALMEQRFAEERDKTNDTIALVAVGLLLLITLNHGNDGEDGKDGKDGRDGKRCAVMVW